MSGETYLFGQEHVGQPGIVLEGQPPSFISPQGSTEKNFHPVHTVEILYRYINSLFYKQDIANYQIVYNSCLGNFEQLFEDFLSSYTLTAQISSIKLAENSDHGLYSFFFVQINSYQYQYEYQLSMYWILDLLIQ